MLEAAKHAGSNDTADRSFPRRLVVCDTTHPVTVDSLDLSDAFVLVSSKSGTTLEPNDLFAYVVVLVARSLAICSGDRLGNATCQACRRTRVRQVLREPS